MVSRVGIVLHGWEGVWSERGSRAAESPGVMVLAHTVVRLVKGVVLRMVLSVTNRVVSVLLQLDKGGFARARGRATRGVGCRGLLGTLLLLLLLLLLHRGCSRRGRGRVVLQRVGHAGLAAAAS